MTSICAKCGHSSVCNHHNCALISHDEEQLLQGDFFEMDGEIFVLDKEDYRIMAECSIVNEDVLF